MPALPAVVVRGDRLLWVWAVAPLGLLSLATVKNAHYAIPAQVPWSIWAALAVAGIAHRLRRRGFDRIGLRRAGLIGFAALALIYGLFLWLVAPRFDRRGVEWAFYESVGRRVPRTMPIALLYDDWDRLPYANPFGPFPHDLAVRLFYLGRPACWHNDYGSMFSHVGFPLSCFQRPCPSDGQAGSAVPSESAFGVIGRSRDLPMLEQLGRVEIIANGPSIRADRTYSLFRVWPGASDDRISRQARARAAY